MSKILFVKSFNILLRLLDFNNKGYEIFRRWYIDGKGYYHMIVDPKNPKKGILEMRPIDAGKNQKDRRGSSKIKIRKLVLKLSRVSKKNTFIVISQMSLQH